MRIDIDHTACGYSLRITGAWESESHEVAFPENVWRDFPAKELLRNELAYLYTLATPLILRHPTVWYSSPEPLFFDFYNECFELSIPNMVEAIAHENADEILELFRSTGRHFTGDPIQAGIANTEDWKTNRVVLPFSYGKDSLLSLATLRALGYEVFPVYVDDLLLPRGKTIRRKLKHEMDKDLDILCHYVKNEIQILSDFEILKRPETRLNLIQVYFVYILAMLPFCYYYRAPTIVLSNEYHHSLNHVHQDGYVTPDRIMQSDKITVRINNMVKQLTGAQVAVCDLIGGLGDFAIHRILHEEFPIFNKYRVSCNMELSQYHRWCHECNKCAQAFIFYLACGRDPFDMGFESSMLEKSKMPHFNVFKKTIHIKDTKIRFQFRDEYLAMQMAKSAGIEGELLETFQCLASAKLKKQTAKLTKEVFRLHKKPGKSTIERKAAALFKSFLKQYQQ